MYASHKCGYGLFKTLEILTFSLHPPHDCTHVSCQVPAAGGGGQVLLRVQSVGVNHEVSVRQVTERRRCKENGDISTYCSTVCDSFLNVCQENMSDKYL